MLSNLRYFLMPVLRITGSLLIGFSFMLFVPCLVSILYADGASSSFEIAGLACLATGVILKIATRGAKRELQPRDGFLLATLIWVVLPVFGAVPMLLEIPGLSFTHAYFEAMSGTTTTCATVLSGIDSLPASINFWRCFLSWLGGMGILVLAVAILPMLGVGGAQIFKAEASGPMKESRITPRIADTAKGLWWIYLALSTACFLGYWAAGMNAFDSLVHMFSTVSLGGFSSHDASFGYWNNPTIESVAIVFMLICGISFSLHFVAWNKRSITAYLKNSECLCWLGLCVVVTTVVAVLLYVNGQAEEPAQALRLAAFNVVSTVSTSGFASTDFNLWPAAAYLLMFFCACFASCGGSTGGGVKMLRVIMLVKQIRHQMRITVQPNAVRSIVLNGQPVEEGTVTSALSFMLLWFCTSIAAYLALLLTGLDSLTAFGSVIACITNLGPGLGAVGPYANFSVLSDPQLWLCSFCMLIGRLELVTVFVLFTRSFWHA